MTLKLPMFVGASWRWHAEAANRSCIRAQRHRGVPQAQIARARCGSAPVKETGGNVRFACRHRRPARPASDCAAERRKFVPHLTLGRVGRGQSRGPHVLAESASPNLLTSTAERASGERSGRVCQRVETRQWTYVYHQLAAGELAASWLTQRWLSRKRPNRQTLR